MRLTRAVTVQFNALRVKGCAYQQWQGDEAVCDGCGATVIVRFAQEPSWQHFQNRDRQAADYVVPERRG
jgi:hypothetical protein